MARRPINKAKPCLFIALAQVAGCQKCHREGQQTKREHQRTVHLVKQKIAVHGIHARKDQTQPTHAHVGKQVVSHDGQDHKTQYRKVQCGQPQQDRKMVKIICWANGTPDQKRQGNRDNEIFLVSDHPEPN